MCSSDLGIYNSKKFDSWRKKAEKENAEILYLSREYLMQHSAGDITRSEERRVGKECRSRRSPYH